MFTETPTGEEQNRILDFIMEVGQSLLENGGEVFRVQQTMYIMAHAMHLQPFSVYVITNGIFATAGGEGLSAQRHIPRCGIHLGRVTALNELSRALAEGQVQDLEEGERRLEEIRNIPPSSFRLQIAASGAGAAFFAMLFGGSPADGAVAAVCGLLLSVFMIWAEKKRMVPLFAKLIGSALVFLIGQGCAVLFSPVEPDAAIIGALLVLTPGVPFTNGVRDLLHGDYLSGGIRLMDAALTAGAMACGVLLAYNVMKWGGAFG